MLMPAKVGDVVSCPPQVVLGQTIANGGQAYVVEIKKQQFGNAVRQVNTVQDKYGNRTEYFDTDCWLAREAR